MGAPKIYGALGCSLVSLMVNPALIIIIIIIITYVFNNALFNYVLKRQSLSYANIQNNNKSIKIKCLQQFCLLIQKEILDTVEQYRK